MLPGIGLMVLAAAIFNAAPVMLALAARRGPARSGLSLLFAEAWPGDAVARATLLFGILSTMSGVLALSRASVRLLEEGRRLETVDV